MQPTRKLGSISGLSILSTSRVSQPISTGMSSTQVQSLTELGIPKQKAIYALREHGNEIEAACDWCFGEGMDWTPQSLLQTSYKPHRGEGEASETSATRDIRYPAGSARVPAHRSILPGVTVEMILKQDQPTGRTVSGVVQDVLTKGDHPRGVKVRLTDGRVGRVVRVV